ncbi:putative glycoside hydrolase [Fusobacterium sp.]|uniref:putative glycoside hydrolase n=1 Tax=Fusobacterium sp. TaxID=68766 RepID=UPI0029041FEB|nr:putative glycoside hydrolase [Fusobacterium sp.]MDU1911520.1 putative glycoside hydrolase [Fusobacterium sp.]
MKHKRTKQQVWFIRKVLFSIFCYIVFLVATVDVTKGMSLGDIVISDNKIVVKEVAKGNETDEKKLAEESGEKPKDEKITEEAENPSTAKEVENTEKSSEIINEKYKYTKGNIRIFKDVKITPKAEDNIKIGTRVEILEEKKVEKIKEKTVKKPDGKREVQKITIVENWEKISYYKNREKRTGWIKNNQLTDSLKATLPKEWKNLNFSPIEKKNYTENKRREVRGIYVTSNSAALTKRVDDFIALSKRTKINAFVIDVKEDDGTLLFKMEAGEKYNPNANRRSPIKDINKFMKKLKDNNIYTIARIVSFKDPTYAKANPDRAIITKATGKPFTNSDGVIWVSPHDRYLWEYNIAVAKEAALAGFDEIQFDYVRFPASNGGKLDKELDYRNSKKESKPETIQKYLQYARQELEPLGVYIAADVYGQVGSLPDDMALGQHWESVSNVVDYICPMIYPSHYGKGVYGLSVPDAEPYKTVYRSTQDSMNRNANIDTPAMIRPWIQAFTARWVKGHITYGPEQIELQVKALKDLGINEYILWSPTNKYRIEKNSSSDKKTEAVKTTETTKKTDGAKKTEEIKKP